MRSDWLRLSKYLRLLIIFASLFVLLFLLSADHSSQGTAQNIIADKSCKCQGETFCFQVGNLIGEMFDCSLLKYLREFHLTESDIVNTEITNFNYKQVVFITYSSSNHFTESRQMLTDFRKKFQNKIIYYDIGLNKGELAELANVCNLEVRQFNFSAYPAHVKTLGTYAFKVMIEAEISVSYNVFWMVDTSLVFEQLSVLQQFYLDVKNGKAPDFMIGQKVAKEIEFTHPGMRRYIPFPEKYRNESQREAVLFFRATPTSKTILKWAVLCALTKECIAPSGSVLYCGSPPASGCHRFDQSSSSLLFRSFYPPDTPHYKYYHHCAKPVRGVLIKTPLSPIYCNETLS